MHNLSGGIHVIVVLAAASIFASNGVQAKKAKETVLYNFSGSDGAYPAAQLAEDRKGNLYGTTTAGGASSGGDGVIFKLSPDGTETVLHSFSGADGVQPSGNVVLGGKDLFGATLFGGANNLGVVYRLAQNGKFDVLHSFGKSGDAASPSGWVVWDKAGFVYLAAQGGGAYGFGAIYKVAAANGKETLVYSFTGALDGGNPVSCLKLPSGTLYGEATQGGANGAGVVFKIATEGTESVLYSFNVNDNGGYDPAGPLANDNSSNLYGTAEFGGKNGVGTAFRVTPDGTFTLLHTFGGGSDGVYPLGLFAGPDAFYGMTLEGGSGSGVVFRMEANGAEKVLYRFTGGADGSRPQAPPIVDKHRNVYGTTLDGGSSGAGVVFALKARK